MSGILKVCMVCGPVAREVPGLLLSHGYCRFHGLEYAEQSDLIEWHERIELWVRRHWLLTIIILAALVAAFTLTKSARHQRALSPRRSSMRTPVLGTPYTVARGGLRASPYWTRGGQFEAEAN